jgi:hypothetical protein
MAALVQRSAFAAGNLSLGLHAYVPAKDEKTTWICAGVLLAASDDLERSIFRRSVVLVYEHSRRGGARGVILSQPLGPSDPRLVPSRGPASLPRGAPALSHFLGGPVGMPGVAPSPNTLESNQDASTSRWSSIVEL